MEVLHLFSLRLAKRKPNCLAASLDSKVLEQWLYTFFGGTVLSAMTPACLWDRQVGSPVSKLEYSLSLFSCLLLSLVSCCCCYILFFFWVCHLCRVYLGFWPWRHLCRSLLELLDLTWACLCVTWTSWGISHVDTAALWCFASELEKLSVTVGTERIVEDKGGLPAWVMETIPSLQSEWFTTSVNVIPQL